MPIAILIGILIIWIIYSIVQGCIKDTPVIKDKNALLNSFVGKSQTECRKILKEYKKWEKDIDIY